MPQQERLCASPMTAPQLFNLESRLNELELKFTEQAHAVEELSGVVYAQQRALDLLQLQLRQLQTKTEGEPGLVDASRNDKPPHY
jgi:SlyX protein